jgi:hypothetical protein
MARAIPSKSLTPEESNNLLAAYRGLNEFLGCNVGDWEINWDKEEVTAKGVSFNEGIDADQVIRDISLFPRKIDFFNGLRTVIGRVPQVPFSNSQEMTNFMVLYFKGAVEEGSFKAPLYLRNAVQEYKRTHGLELKRGPKPRRVIRLDEIAPEDIAEIQAALDKAKTSHE